MSADMTPGSADWLKVMSASKIAAVVGLSPYESRYSLWLRMAGVITDEPNDATRRGHYLEQGIRDWFQDQHPGWVIQSTSCSYDDTEPRFTATPDGYAIAEGEPDPIRVLEIKTAADAAEWGEPGTDEIPPGYLCQVQWQLMVTGCQVAHVAVLLPFLRFAEYVVHANPDDQAYLRREALAFLDSLERDERPDIDAHGATYEAVRKEHPQIDGTTVEINPLLADAYLEAVLQERTAAHIAQRNKNLLLDRMGDAREAVCNGNRIAIRKPGRGGSVSLVPTLPKTEKAEAAA
jgi:putative phage-type endonuclease